MFLARRQNGYYYLWYVDGGKRRKVTTKTKKKAEALQFLRSFKPQTHQDRPKDVSCQLFFQEFLQYSRTVHTLNTQEHFGTAFREFLKFLGDRPVAAVGVRDIEAFLAHKTEQTSLATARKYHIAIASAFSTARRWKYISENPWREVKKPRLPEKPVVFLPKDHLHTLLSMIDDPELLDVVTYALNTGCRLGEIVTVEYSDLDMDRKLIRVTNKDDFVTKSKRLRVVPMTGTVYELLRRREAAASCNLVFHRNKRRLIPETVSKKFKKYVRLAGTRCHQQEEFEKYHFHHLRSTFSVYLLAEKVSIWELSKILGHHSVAVTEKHYANLLSVELHDVVNKLRY